MKTQFAWHIHHHVLVEPLVEPLEKRVEYIKANKMPNQHATRLHLFKRVKGQLPKEVRKVGAAFQKAGVAWKKADAAWKKIADVRQNVYVYQVARAANIVAFVKKKEKVKRIKA